MGPQGDCPAHPAPHLFETSALRSLFKITPAILPISCYLHERTTKIPYMAGYSWNPRPFFMKTSTTDPAFNPTAQIIETYKIG